MNDTLSTALALIPALVFAIVFHEVAHGFVARLLGDPTASEQRRLSLNPLRHVDPIGTVILPGILALSGAPVFGWAKPVPVNKWRLRNPRYGMMAVAAAGPGSNLILAGVAAVALGLIAHGYSGPPPSGALGLAVASLQFFIMINIFLALFNLLPIPPFDGSHIVEGLLPRRLARAYASVRRLGFALVLVLLIVLPTLVKGFDPVGALIGAPVDWLTGHYFGLAQWIAGGSRQPVG